MQHPVLALQGARPVAERCMRSTAAALSATKGLAAHQLGMSTNWPGGSRALVVVSLALADNMAAALPDCSGTAACGAR